MTPFLHKLRSLLHRRGKEYDLRHELRLSIDGGNHP